MEWKIPALRSIPFLLAGLIALLPAVLWANGTGRAASPAEHTAVRAVHRWDAVLAVGLAGAALAVSGLAYVVGFTGIAGAVGRNTAVYLGIALLLTPVVGHRVAAPLTAAYPLVCAGVGGRADGGAEPWALVLHRPDSAPALAAGVAVLAAGGAFALATPPAAGGVRWLRTVAAQFRL
ncbi:MULTISPECIES: hypothetical protein [Streptomyces]|uniref:hypothetical protein n=1 Tax=Streptomyces TaxID=1883 RepID=UPI0016799DE2|nr:MULTISPECIES: hypothetical protein [Streptomyces]MBD3575320.1 hypothetical protein [Streptomyces sp. KD18]GGS92323.1 hypothetical protein GCM10010286_16350 [Streptomyces toxytricini]